MADNFNLKEWLIENNQGPYQLNENFAGRITPLKPINKLFETDKDSEEDDTDTKNGAKGAPGIPHWLNLDEPDTYDKYTKNYDDEESGTPVEEDTDSSDEDSTLEVNPEDKFKVKHAGKEWTVNYHNHEEGDPITLTSGKDKVVGKVVKVSPEGAIKIKLDEANTLKEDNSEVKPGQKYKFTHGNAILHIKSIDGEDVMTDYIYPGGKTDASLEPMHWIKSSIKTGVLAPLTSKSIVKEERVRSFKDFVKQHNIKLEVPGKVALNDLKKFIPTLDTKSLYNAAEILANIFLNKKIGMDWDDLGDTNSLWDYIHEGMSGEEFVQSVKEAVQDRLEAEDYDMF